ncbi:MAG TPA: ribonuclease III, partial [Clostridiales bacterium]|nr:ribonuclease III [Clostridiales bacterium]
MAIGREITELQEKLGYRFSDLSYLENALTHASYANEQNRRGAHFSSNERLEFLGDAVLEIAVSEHLYTTYTDCSEGELTRMRQSVVCTETLARLASELSVGEYLNVGNGEEEHGLRTRQRVLANATEAIFAAVYLDAKAKGSDAWRTVILNLLKKETEAQAAALPDAKTRLQELVEKDGSATLT